MKYKQRTIAAAIILLSAYLVSALMTIKDTDISGLSPALDDPRAYVKRFGELSDLLPPGGVVGYVSNKPFDPNDTFILKRYYLTQYALVPRVVIVSPKPEFVVGNFHAGDMDYEMLSAAKLRPIKDFGGGVVLFRGTDQ